MIQPTPLDIIEAKGQVLAYYFMDLKYIQTFQMFKNENNQIIRKKYIDDDFGFNSFLKEFKVIRNVRSGMSESLLNHTYNWISLNNKNDVDGFKIELQNNEITTRNYIMTSLCSKILFLNNPTEIMPFDINVRTAICYNKDKDNIYDVFSQKINEYYEQYSTIIDNFITSLIDDMTRIETIFIDRYNDTHLNFPEIRNKRIIDKLLWTVGKNKE